MIYFFIWWLIIEILGWLALPLAMRVLRFLPDRGYTFSKALGLLVSSYVLWLGASTRFLNNDLGGIFFSILALAGISFFVSFYRNRGLNLQDKPDSSSESQPNTAHTAKVAEKPAWSAVLEFLRENKRLVLTVEILFVLAFATWAILRAYAPYKIMQSGGEKYMEIAFLNAIINSKQFPPLDPWLSGFSISYYYFGYVMMALVTRLSGVPSGVGFDLYDALLFSLTVLGAFGIVYNLIASSRSYRGNSGTFMQPIRYGLLGSAFVAVLGNWEGLLEVLYSRRILPEAFWKWIDIPDLLGALATGSWNPGSSGGWWWWRASRVLQDLNLDYQPVPVSPISEFPFFSFLLGDNHPHVLALPFVFLAIALTFNLLLRILRLTSRNQDTENRSSSSSAWWNPVAYALESDWPFFLTCALVLGGLGFLNTWDLPIYLGLLILVYGGGWYALQRRSSVQRVSPENNLSDEAKTETESGTTGSVDWSHQARRIISLGAGLLVASIVLYIFFYFSFSSQAAGILPYIFPPTRLPQFLVMFGPFITILIFFLVSNLITGNGSYKTMLPKAARAWLWVILSCILLFAILLLTAVLMLNSQSGSNAESALDPVLKTALGGRTLAEAIQVVLSSRLRDPALFLLLSSLLALTITNFVKFSQPSNNSQTPMQEQARNLYLKTAHDPSGLFVFILVFTGLALTFITEFLYLRDSFGYRMNTIFKFYYQAWVMLSCASVYAIWWLSNPGKLMLSRWFRYTVHSFSLVVIAAGMVYPVMAFYNRVNAFQSKPNLDGASEFAQNNPEDWAVIQWLRQNALISAVSPSDKAVPVLLEAPGTSYSHEGRISAFSGIPAVLGWAIHESQWRGNYDEQGKREPDIITIYTSSDVNLTLELLRKWNVKYVILGQAEYNYIQRSCQDASRRCSLVTVLRKFEQAAQLRVLMPVFNQGTTTIYQVP